MHRQKKHAPRTAVHSAEGIDRAASRATTDTDIAKAPRTLKRTLKTTVATVLAAVAAALLSNSDEVGEWLKAVAPNVMPHAEAGAEMLHKTIEGAKSCYQEGVNVCLDAEGHATALCELNRVLFVGVVVIFFDSS